jgi:hypothetical protein
MKRLPNNLTWRNWESHQIERFHEKGYTVVNRIILFGIALSAFGAGQAAAQNCTTASTAGLKANKISSLIANQYACADLSATEHWNELHNSASGSGSVLDYKKGPTDPVDPSDTVSHPTGTFSITAPSGDANPGVITYTYPSGSFGYYVVNNLTPPLYSFCGESGGAPQLAVTIQATHC